MKHSEDVPVFGERVVGQRYVVRPSAYAVIQNEGGQVAVVATRRGYFLPGGGLEMGETAEQAIVREALEECGILVRPGETIAEAVQLVYSVEEDVYFEKVSVFLRAVIERADNAATETEHELMWIPGEAAAHGMAHESHAWAIRRAAQPVAADGGAGRRAPSRAPER